MIEACRYVDEVIADAPFEVDETFLAEHDIAIVVHGDDLTPQDVEVVYGAAAAAGRLELLPRTPGISTTDLIRRVLDADASGSLGI